MVRIGSSSGNNFVGLADSVAYRFELGIALVDDGDRLLRINQSLFEHVLAPGPAVEANPALLQVVKAYPTVFALFDTEEAARRSLDDKEL